MKQDELINKQFGNTANAYLSSNVHAEGADLQQIMDKIKKSQLTPAALDLGCGAGHVAFAMAKAGASVTAYDLSPQMLAIVNSEATQRGLGNIKTHQGVVEKLPFEDAVFDLVVTRFSAHHWSDVPSAIREVRRVLKPDGQFILIDIVAAENPLFDTLLQTVEILRDASHVRDYRVSEWNAILKAENFNIFESDRWKLTMEFTTWTSRMCAPEVRINAIRDVFSNASDEARLYFNVQPDYSFDIDVSWLSARQNYN